MGHKVPFYKCKRNVRGAKYHTRISFDLVFGVDSFRRLTFTSTNPKRKFIICLQHNQNLKSECTNFQSFDVPC